MDSLQRLQSWFASQCDGEWEHSFGVQIDTLDNPGWSVTIDLADTPWADLSMPSLDAERTPTDWVHVKVSAGKFSAAGGPYNLSEIVDHFLRAVSARSS
jgi:hypothetical protein